MIHMIAFWAVYVKLADRWEVRPLWCGVPQAPFPMSIKIRNTYFLVLLVVLPVVSIELFPVFLTSLALLLEFRLTILLSPFLTRNPHLLLILRLAQPFRRRRHRRYPYH